MGNMVKCLADFFTMGLNLYNTSTAILSDIQYNQWAYRSEFLKVNDNVNFVISVNTYSEMKELASRFYKVHKHKEYICVN